MDKDIMQAIASLVCKGRKSLADATREVFTTDYTTKVLDQVEAEFHHYAFKCSECRQWRLVAERSTTGWHQSCDRCFDSGEL
jgi:hypothetical protein